MQSGKSKLTVHTAIVPEMETREEKSAPRIQWKVLPHPQRGSRARRVKAQKKRAVTARKPLSTGEKLLRNAAVACSLLLIILALNNVDQPWTKQAAEGVKRAMTMQLNLDESLGKLSFVRELVPDTALVFWNMGGNKQTMLTPVSGTLTHAYDANQPWFEYQCTGAQPVVSALPGQVTAVGQGAGGDWTVLIDHADGQQTVYAYLHQAEVKVGDKVEAGTRIGDTADGEASRLYFEYRVNGIAQNPSAEQ